MFASVKAEDESHLASLAQKRNGSKEGAAAARKKNEHQGARGCALQRAVRARDGRDALPACAAGDVVAALGAEKSELLAVFLASKLRSEDVAKLSGDKSSSFVQGAVGAAASSAVIPHTTRASSLTHALNTGLVSFKEIPVEKLEEFLSGSEGKSAVSDGKTDLLVVRIGSEYTLPETDALIKAASEVLSTATKGSVDFALTGDEAEPKQISAPLSRRRLAPNANSTASAVVICETGLLVGYSGGKAFCFSHYVHMTPDLLTGLLFGFFFIFLAYVGLSALSAIQTPLRYPSHGPPRGKEF